MRVLSHPFRIDATGAAATVEEGSDSAHAEAIAVIVMTRQGERDLVPTFGITDPTFAGIDVAEVNVCLDDFGPPITVTAVEVTNPTDTTERVTLAYEEK